ncbi:LLM class flavin-dependent oxidoreductase [Segniliparus rugosus]|uniref:Alkanesulfonate monooxygenase, FMNH(2)-dependent n=1 Tax=Segniliparus rugosus (strain ATCC BAA-974 / DSM 45345 / CCUG 50838 / CIP 108380 / JCM 13579 / CDC 945) TaxID=679197 RepID=E5XTF6_SEGRC|nr:alkanesulfonate monooxygenase, FMNH(2)-dependent [Segniliparus rugosus ATCC BAA-974]
MRGVTSRPPLSFHWFLPTYGDSRGLIAGGHGTHMSGDRPATLRYLKQISLAAEENGFEAVLTPTGAWCEDAWLTTALLVESTETLKFLVAFRPGLISPTLAAQMAATYQWHSGGRLLLNVVTGGEAHEQQAYGDFLPKAERYERCAEFLDVVRRLWTSHEPVSLDGTHVRVHEALLARRPDPVPPVFFGGSSPEAGRVAAAHADTYLTWGEPLDAVREKIDWIRSLAAERGRELTYGLRIHVISRDTSEQAWAEAARLLAGVDPADVARVQQNLARSESEGQRRMLALHGGSADNLEISPNLWAGVGLVRGGAGTALVGSHAEVADRIAEYADLGIDHFILSGYPHVEEAYWFGEGVLPILADRGLWRSPNRGEAAASGVTAFVGSRG